MKVSFPTLTDQEREKRLRPATGKIRLVIDSDAKNEVDDQFAIAWALRSQQRFQLEAVYAAPFSHDCFGNLLGKVTEKSGIHYAQNPATGMEESYEEIEKLFSLLGENPDGRIFRGADAYLSDRKAPVDSPAVQDLIARGLSSQEPLYVAAIGAPTNIASALLLEPELVKHIVVVWLGGQPLWFKHGIEFNLMQDVQASQVLFDSGVPLVYIPCMNVASLLTVSEDELRNQLTHQEPAARYLAQLVLDTFKGSGEDAAKAAAVQRQLYLKGRDDFSEDYLSQFPSREVAWSRVIWDLAAIAFLKNPNWAPSTLEVSPILSDDLTWKPEDPVRHKIRVVNYLHRDLIYGDLFDALSGQKE